MDNQDLDAGKANESAPPIESPVQPKMVPQDEVNEIVSSRMNAAAEKARRETQAQYEARINEYEAKLQEQRHTGNSADSAQEQADIRSEIRREMDAEFKRRMEEAEQRRVIDESNRIYGEFNKKLGDDSIKQKYEDFDELKKINNPDLYPHVMLMSNDLPNTADVYYHLMKNDTALEEIERLAKEGKFDKAKYKLKKMSDDIVNNEKSVNNYKKAPEPLSRIKPGTVGGDKGRMGLEDYKSKYRF